MFCDSVSPPAPQSQCLPWTTPLPGVPFRPKPISGTAGQNKRQIETSGSCIVHENGQIWDQGFLSSRYRCDVAHLSDPKGPNTKSPHAFSQQVCLVRFSRCWFSAGNENWNDPYKSSKTSPKPAQSQHPDSVIPYRISKFVHSISFHFSFPTCRGHSRPIAPATFLCLVFPDSPLRKPTHPIPIWASTRHGPGWPTSSGREKVGMRKDHLTSQVDGPNKVKLSVYH